MDIFIHLLYFVYPNLDSVPLFVGMRERSITSKIDQEKPTGIETCCNLDFVEIFSPFTVFETIRSEIKYRVFSSERHPHFDWVILGP